jgi:hypothetical protein
MPVFCHVLNCRMKKSQGMHSYKFPSSECGQLFEKLSGHYGQLNGSSKRVCSAQPIETYRLGRNVSSQKLFKHWRVVNAPLMQICYRKDRIVAYLNSASRCGHTQGVFMDVYWLACTEYTCTYTLCWPVAGSKQFRYSLPIGDNVIGMFT